MPVASKYKKCGNKEGILYAWFSAMHTRIDVLLYGKNEKELMAIIFKIETELIKLEKTANFYDTSTELSYLNIHASLSPISVSRELYDIINACLLYNKKTIGHFDISVKSDNYDSSTISSIELSAENRLVYFHQKGVRLDLSGYLKGYALDKIRTLLYECQLENALVNLGNSSVMALGSHPHGEGWKISHMALTDAALTENIHLYNQCLTTSGNETATRKHLINPVTGKYKTGLKYISVITDNGADGEALSTALFLADSTYKEKIIANFPDGIIIPDTN